jgi:hypothetical protein
MKPEAAVILPAIATPRAHKMHADALSPVPGVPGKARVCGVCGAKFTPSRKWQEFDKEKCRKAAWAIRRRLEVPSDIRATLTRIESKLDQLLAGTK